jgi:hypothetical protein
MFCFEYLGVASEKNIVINENKNEAFKCLNYNVN